MVDEFAVLDDHGRVYPYMNPLSLRGAPGEPPTLLSLEELGGPRRRQALRIGVVLFSKYRVGARWRPRTLTPGKAVLSLLAHTVAARSRPGNAFAAFRRVVSSAPVLQGYRGEADEFAHLLLDKISARSAHWNEDSYE